MRRKAPTIYPTFHTEWIYKAAFIMLLCNNLTVTLYQLESTLYTQASYIVTPVCYNVICFCSGMFLDSNGVVGPF